MSSEIDNKNYFGDNFNNKKNHNNCTSNSKEFPFCINTQSSGVGSKKKSNQLKVQLEFRVIDLNLQTRHHTFQLQIYDLHTKAMQHNFW